MINYFFEIWESMLMRTKDFLQLRLLFGPLQSILLATLIAKRDAKKQYPPYIWRFLATSKQRRAISRNAWINAGKIFVLAVSIDIIYQLTEIIMFDAKMTFNALEAALVGLLLTIIPYILMRGPVQRVIGKYYAKRKKGIYDISQRDPPAAS
jgi:hypothetical protein